ncbi:LysR family transcriptional regulator [Roseibium sediminicola]|uniref:LysR family transcriptional regulator n=1 Tax=Roseibium sediminicola TaxID=2933272 RepID=A0ABT0GUN5_9HYPH|nr:LysR family transcriptional regulator [Roseibium sp. CAU 1639]MCK7613141.1 LysR family transcriptional regulator [Roseibium sp. CAU 1639]
MTQKLPPLNWFRAFEAAARHLSFTAAAEEIGMTQSAVSQQIKSLEVRLGVPLFERKPRGLALTDHGRRLLPQVDSALDTLAAATGAFFPDQPSKLLTVSVSISVLQWVISPALPAFRKAHPDIALRFISAIWPDEFSRTIADVEIRFGSKKQAGPKAVLLGSNKLIALKPKDGPTRAEDLPLIEAVGISGGWSTWSKAAGLPQLTPSIYVDSYGAALDLAVRGNGACLVNELLSRQPLQHGLVEPVEPLMIDAKEGYFLSINGEEAEAKAFADWLVKIARSETAAV